MEKVQYKIVKQVMHLIHHFKSTPYYCVKITFISPLSVGVIDWYNFNPLQNHYKQISLDQISFYGAIHVGFEFFQT